MIYSCIPVMFVLLFQVLPCSLSYSSATRLVKRKEPHSRAEETVLKIEQYKFNRYPLTPIQPTSQEHYTNNGGLPFIVNFLN